MTAGYDPTVSTLRQYAEKNFPNHRVETSEEATLTAHSVVGHTMPGDDLATVRHRLSEVTAARIVSLTVKPNAATLVPSTTEDKDSVLDLPRSRPITAGIVGGVVVGVVVGLIVGFALSLAAGIIIGVFAGALGAAVAANIGGGGRFAGQRSWEQPNRPNEAVVLIAALTSEEHEATRAAAAMEKSGVFDVRVVNREGAWHSPNT